ncbi:MAG TPA: carboxypeptidase regulatory-like domain-containing protein [Vicinamibacterales bacterium]|nr:carboxypeptidase regulatory-like domain-containing protein [Vicinamibacterales bacterium]
MLRSRSNRTVTVATLVASALCVLALTTSAYGQGTNATIRGTVQDASGAVLPGATVTAINTGTKSEQTTITDERGQYILTGLFPGTYELRVELSGFKTYDRKNLALSPADNRGLDVRLDIGEQTETVTVTATPELIQTQTGAREGVLTSQQIDNLSIIGRSSLELLRILPGVVTEFNQGESVSFGGGANNTQSYTVNGIRSSSNTVQLDGSSLIDIGSNNGLIVTLNNDMVQEVKVQSSNFAAEYGTGGMSVSAVTKSGTSQFRGQLYDYWRDSSFASNDRSNSITLTPKPKSKYNYPGGNIGGPLFFGDDYTRNRDRLFFFVAYEVQRQQIDSGARFSRTYTEAMRNGDFSELLANRGSNLNSIPQLRIPQGFPNAGQPAPNNDMRPYIHPMGAYLAGLYPQPNYSDPDNEFNYVYSALEPANRFDFKSRFDWNISSSTKAYVRVAYEGETTTNPRGVWWGPSDVALPTSNIGENRGRSYAGNVVSVLSPSMTNEVLVSYSRLTLDNSFEDPSLIRQGAGGITFNGIFPAGSTSPYLPTDILHGWGGSGQVGNLWAAGNDVYAHNDALQFRNTLTKLAGTHGLKFGAAIERGQKQQNFQNLEAGQLWFGTDNTTGTGNSAADMLVGRIGSFTQGTAASGNPSPGQPFGEFRYWSIDAFAQDSWRIWPNLTFEYGVRFGYWTNNRELNGLGGYFTSELYDPNAGSFLDPGTYQRLNGVCYVYTGCAPDGILENRSAFALPRVNVAWNIDGEGNNVVRGGYGLFYNRNMGNVEYDNTLRMPPNAYQVATDFWAGGGYGNGLGLTYDTVSQATLANRIGSIGINSLTPDSFAWPQTHSFSLSYARRIPWNQVIEASYVGTRQRDLVSRQNGNVMPFGALSSGTFNGVDLSVPVNRVAVASVGDNLASFRPFNALNGITLYSFRGEANFNSLQVTLSRQTSRALQYFLAYTYGRTKGTLGDEYSTVDPYDPDRTYGVLSTDRTHILNVSWNAFLPDGARGAMDNAIGRGILNGWQLSGISSMASGIPLRLSFSGAAAANSISAAYFGTADVVGPSLSGGNGLAPIYTCDPRTDGTGVGEKMLNLDCISVPPFGQNGDLVPPYNIRTPTRFNHDLTLFKNFTIKDEQKLQFRVGFFNLFNQAFANTNIGNDINLVLDTTCRVTVNNVPDGTGGVQNNVCDPTGGFDYTQQTRANFGTINLKRGHRVIEFVLKYYF